MGSCLSKRKFLNDAAVTHNTSPRTSKEFSEQPGCLIKDMAAVVTEEDSSSAKKKGKLQSSLFYTEHRQTPKSPPHGDISPSLALLPPFRLIDSDATSVETVCVDGNEPQFAADFAQASVIQPQEDVPESTKKQAFWLKQQSGAFKEETELKLTSSSKLKRSRSYDNSVLEGVKRPSRSFLVQMEENQEQQKREEEEDTECTLSHGLPPLQLKQSCTARATMKGASSVKCSKFLEGLDLVDLEPNPARAVSSIILEVAGGCAELQSAGDDEMEEHARISADFFELKNRYLSSRSTTSSQEQRHGENDTISKDRRLSTWCSTSMDASDGDESQRESQSLYDISMVQENFETNDSSSTEGETLEFRPGQDGNLAEQNGEQHENQVGRVSVVLTGDAVLVAGAKSNELHLIPSKSYFREELSSSSSLGRSSRRRSMETPSVVHEQQHRQHERVCTLSVDDIIKLLERDELDDDMLMSLFSAVSVGTGAGTSLGSRNDGGVGSSGGTRGGAMTPPSSTDALSEASFEFKLVSRGSTPPHSTPSTPMLSAGSTPARRHITQLSPVALTAEEIAEIWGVFEQRQAAALTAEHDQMSSMCIAVQASGI